MFNVIPVSSHQTVCDGRFLRFIGSFPPDQPYILAFSLIMLHTDAFNRHNKHKMTKPDYIKNTRLPDLPPEVLDVSCESGVFCPN